MIGVEWWSWASGACAGAALALAALTIRREKETPGHEGRGHHTNKEHTR